MPLVDLSLGVTNDRPPLSDQPFLWRANNIRVRAGYPETIGLIGPVRDYDAGGGASFGTQINLPGAGIYRKIFHTPAAGIGQIIAGSNTNLTGLQADPAATPATGVRFETVDLTPVSLPAANDTVTSPSVGRVEIPPVWWFDDQDDLVVGARADVVGDGVYVWDRTFNPAGGDEFVALTPDPNPLGGAATAIPVGAVAGGIINRTLVLLGCSEENAGSPGTAEPATRFMTYRWCDKGAFGQWTSADTTSAGGDKLEGGSRIVGGGIVGFGVVIWTDKRMAVLRETFDTNVFDRDYIDGGRGLLANNAWCEADGRVWWLDEHRTLNVYDGGRPRQIVNTNKVASVERLEDPQVSRIDLVANQEFGEIIISYPEGNSDNPDKQLVYNYIHDVWYPWSIARTAWTGRVGSLRSMTIDTNGDLFQHDLDVPLGPPWGDPITPTAPLADDDVIEYSWSWSTNLISQPDPTLMSWESSRVVLDYIPQPVTAARNDTFTVSMTGYDATAVTSPVETDTQTFGGADNVSEGDYRVGGKAIQVSASGTAQKTVWRFGAIDVSGRQAGER